MLLESEAREIVYRSLYATIRRRANPEETLGQLGLKGRNLIPFLIREIALGKYGVRRYLHEIDQSLLLAEITPGTTIGELAEIIKTLATPSSLPATIEDHPSIIVADDEASSYPAVPIESPIAAYPSPAYEHEDAEEGGGEILPPAAPSPEIELLPPRLQSIETPSSKDEVKIVSSDAKGENRSKDVIRLWYGTNRMRVDQKSIERGFGSGRDTKLHLGQCEVYVPKSHKIGSLGSSLIKRILKGEDDRLKLIRIMESAPSDHWRELRKFLIGLRAEERIALIYLHGFNVTFEQAALRAGQIGFDLGITGAMAFYSWPSKGKLTGYAADEATIEASEGYIEEFLTHFATQSGAEKVHIIAHSMGNRGLLRVIQRIIASVELSSKVKFGQIFLAAPDVDTEVFLRLAQHYPQVSERTTLYISDKDRALKSSGIIHDAPRAGFNPPLTVVSGIDTVEVTNIDLTVLGHSYFGEAREVLTDMYNLLLHNDEPEKRMGLERMYFDNDQYYWRIRA